MRWQDRLTKERLRFFKGSSEFSSIKNVIILYAVIDIWMKTKFEEGITFLWSCAFFLGVIIGYWTIGYVWDKLKLYDAESRFGNERNPLMKELQLYLKKQRFK